MSIIPTIHLKDNFSKKFTTNIKSENISKLTQCSRLLDEILNRKPNQHLPYVGAAAFSHKGGLHVSAVQKDPKTYEHVKPELVGNVRNIVVSDQAGKSNIISRLKSFGVDLKENDPKIKKLLEEVKDREFIGYSYDGADASFELLARRIMGEIPRYISIKEYDVSVKKDKSGKFILVEEGTEVHPDAKDWFANAELVEEQRVPVNGIRAAAEQHAMLVKMELIDLLSSAPRKGAGKEEFFHPWIREVLRREDISSENILRSANDGRWWEKAPKDILAKVGDRFITSKDFLQRAEYTICLLYTSPSPRDRG